MKKPPFGKGGLGGFINKAFYDNSRIVALFSTATARFLNPPNPPFPKGG
ncbi:hypothetical protein [Chromatium okenii]|nr:hypothetical protein [Chromatium okenii]MBV5309003.1 hypothetical protein [Chromatium okenii]